MSIDEIIKKRNLAQNLTQKNIPDYLGVSTQAVNKQEKGVSYPDISLLPALARLLKTDLNSLLSFNEDLTDKEIGVFANELFSVIENDWFECGYKMAMEKLQEFPASNKLIYTIAFTLDSSINLFKNGEKEKYREQSETLYERIAESEHLEVRYHAVSMLVSKSIERDEFDKAQELINDLAKHSFDYRPLQVNLLIKQNKSDEALDILEMKFTRFFLIYFL